MTAADMTGRWLMYLRKSRSDDQSQTVEEVLAKHETILQEWAVRELGYRITEEDTFREVVSGETIADRTEIKKVLALIESRDVRGVIVVEPQRLSRGELEDCGRIITAFRLTDTLIATPMMTYDLSNKMDRRFFQDELMRGRDYLEYTKEILARGRVAAIRRGAFIGSHPPFGYKRVKQGKDWTLEIVPEEAEIVRHIFELCVGGASPNQIAKELNGLGIKAKTGGPWTKDSIRDLLKNRHYIGQVFLGYRKAVKELVDGKIEKHLRIQDDDSIIIAEGKHPAIIDKALFDQAQGHFHPHTRAGLPTKNPLAGILYCSGCGRVMVLHQGVETGKGHRYRSRYECVNCAKNKTAFSYDVLATVRDSLQQAELPELEARAAGSSDRERQIRTQQIKALEDQLAELRKMEENQYDLLENGTYTTEIFAHRNAILRQKIKDTEEQIETVRASVPPEVDYKERVLSLRTAIEALSDPDRDPADVNALMRKIVRRIEYSSEPRGTGKHGQTNYNLRIDLDL